MRTSSYDLTHAAAGQPRAPGGHHSLGSLDSGLIFERDTSLFGQSSTQTLEPRLFYVYVPYRDQDAIPIFDTALADFNYAQLFTENRFVGGDRFGDANQVDARRSPRASCARAARSCSAPRSASATTSSDERVGLTPTSPLRTATDSDILASRRRAPRRRPGRFDTTTQYNRARAARRALLDRRRATRRRPPRCINASYRYNRDTRCKQIDISGQWPVAAGWYAVGRYNYSFLDSACWKAWRASSTTPAAGCSAAVASASRRATQPTRPAFFFQLEFNGLGQIGTDDAVELLKRNVPGYSRHQSGRRRS